MSDIQGFRKAIHFVLSAEGGISNDSADSGGLTKYGISHAAYPSINIAKLTLSEAITIYYNDYWTKNKCYLFSDNIGIVLFDTAVNCGNKTAIKCLQKAVNNKGSKLNIDGIIGTKTIQAIQQYKDCYIVNGMLAFRLKYYTHIVKHKPSQVRFIRGWVNRVSDLMLYLK